MKIVTFKEKHEVLENIFKEYSRLQTKLKYLEQQNFYPSIDYSQVRETKTHYSGIDTKWNRYIEEKKEIEEMLSVYDFVISCLSEDAKRIILHEFVSKRKDWWINYYSRSTFYRIKKRAMDEAIFYFRCTDLID